ncbi:MAG TPA: hypothetical protein DD738_12745 [Ruminiclostridium sp.]|nr:hypothetical protein [Ruminiclostridium sp.]
MKFSYDAALGAEYARTYADYFRMPETKRLFFYDQNGSDCTNFCSQCVWAAYGGWIPGTAEKTVAENKERIIKMIRMSFSWYGSLFFSGSNKWCRVVEFYDYCVAPKNAGPSAVKIYEGDWSNIDPSMIQAGDIIQMVVPAYTPYRYGHCLYVTEGGRSFDEVKICCHSADRLDAPLSEFSSFPEHYTRLRMMRFKPSEFIK